MNVNQYNTKNYENISNWTFGENKPNQTQLKPISMPIKPKQTQRRFFSASLLVRLGTPYGGDTLRRNPWDCLLHRGLPRPPVFLLASAPAAKITRTAATAGNAFLSFENFGRFIVVSSSLLLKLYLERLVTVTSLLFHQDNTSGLKSPVSCIFFSILVVTGYPFFLDGMDCLWYVKRKLVEPNLIDRQN